MKRLLFGIISAAVLATGPRALAQGEQWLQYHPASNSMSGYVSLKFDANAPAGVRLPTFVDSKPMYSAWRSPMAKDGKVLMAFDRTKKRGAYDLLYYDHNCDGNLADEKPVKGTADGQESASFGPVPIVFDTNDGPVTYHLGVRFNSYQNRHSAYVYNGGWYDGDVEIDGVTTHVTLSDNDVNGTFNDKSFRFGHSDKIKIGDGRAVQVGNFIQINNKFYNLEVARDGAYVKITDAGKIEMGTVKAPADINEFEIAGINGTFRIRPGKDDGKVPAGTYRVMGWEQFRNDEKGAQWKLHGGIAEANSGTFTLNADSVVEHKLGEPVVATVAFTNDRKNYSFSQVLKGQLGESITMTKGREQVPAPKLLIANKAGNYQKKYSFEYG